MNDYNSARDMQVLLKTKQEYTSKDLAAKTKHSLLHPKLKRPRLTFVVFMNKIRLVQ